MLAGKQLSPILKQVLSNPNIIKVGHCVTSELKYLQQACQSTTSFFGWCRFWKACEESTHGQNCLN